MYEASGEEKLIAIEPPLPEADAGSPSPKIVATEFDVGLAYWTSFRSGGRKVAVVLFRSANIYFGRPNDEALNGHPLFTAGLQAYEFAEVINSAWISTVERRNRVHFRHNPAAFSGLRHFVLPFHDSTFECVAREYEASVTDAEDPASALARVVLRG